MRKQFWKYIIPSMITFLVTGIYISIDGFFVGRAVGDLGIAGINMAWPLAAPMIAIGTGIGMGGAVNISVSMGAGEKEKADKALGNTLVLLLLASIIFSVVLFFAGSPLLRLLGARGQLLALSSEYIKILSYGAVFQIMAVGIAPLFRNQNRAWLAMILAVSTCLIDTVLSGVFVLVLGYGVAGAAYATLIGEGIALIPALMILYKKEGHMSLSNYRLSKHTVHQIIKVGAPVLGLTFVPSLTTVIINYQAIVYGGAAAVAAFAVISYILSVGQLLLQGVGEGSQPLISFCYGADDRACVRQLKNWTYGTAFAISIISLSGILLLRNVIPDIFGISAETTEILKQSMLLCAFSLPFYGFSRVTSEYFNAIKKSRLAAFMVYGEAIVILPLCAFILPYIFQLKGVWIAIVLVQVILTLMGFLLLQKEPLK